MLGKVKPTQERRRSPPQALFLTQALRRRASSTRSCFSGLDLPCARRSDHSTAKATGAREGEEAMSTFRWTMAPGNHGSGRQERKRGPARTGRSRPWPRGRSTRQGLQGGSQRLDQGGLTQAGHQVMAPRQQVAHRLRHWWARPPGGTPVTHLKACGYSIPPPFNRGSRMRCPNRCNSTWPRWLVMRKRSRWRSPGGMGSPMVSGLRPASIQARTSSARPK